MKTILTAALFAATTLSSTFAHAADRQNGYAEDDDRGGVKIGILRCDVGGGLGYVLGSSKELDCQFRSTRGRTDDYTGVIRKLGVDLGYTSGGRIVWAVFAPTAGYHRGSLGGLYGGATVEASVGAGLGANVLLGGTSGSVMLQLISVTGQIGLNVAATGTSVTLNPS
jgi:hypothetical protein